MTYQWSMDGDVMTVRNVELMSRLSDRTRTDLPEGVEIDSAFLQSLADNFHARVKKGQVASVMLRHNEKDKPAEVVGKLANVHFDGKWLRADLVITDPETQARLELGNLPNRSAEFYLNRRVLWGFSLIEGEEGHFGDHWPDLILRGTVGELVTAPKNITVALEKREFADDLMCLLRAQPLKLQTEDVMSDEKTDLKLKAFYSAYKLQGGTVEVQPTAEAEVVTVSEQPTAEEVAEVASAAVDPIDSRVTALEAGMKELREAIASLKGGTEEPTEEPTETDKHDDEDEEVELSKQKKEAEEHLKYLRDEAGSVRLSKLVDGVQDAGSVLTREQIRTKLAECKTDEGRAERAELLKIQSKSDDLDVEDKTDEPKGDYKTRLAAQFETSPHKKQGLTLADYEGWLIKNGYDRALRA